MIILLACGGFWLFALIYYQASLFEQRRKAKLALRKERLAHDEAVRENYGFKRPYYAASFSSDGASNDDMLRVATIEQGLDSLFGLSKDDTREIPTIEDENTGEDVALSDIWEQAIDELELGE